MTWLRNKLSVNPGVANTGWLILLVIAVIFFFAGCSLITSYPGKVSPARNLLSHGRLTEAYERLASRTERGNDRLCYLLECATILHSQGNYEASIREFEKAQQLIQRQEEKALISATDSAAQLSSLLVNEKTIPYRGESFEKIILHTYQALNYLFLGKWEDARVEILRAYQRQKEEAEKHHKDMQRLEEEAEKKQLETDQIFAQVRNEYSDQEAIARRVANAYQNPFTYYLSSLVFRLNGEANDAYIDCKKVYQLRPDFSPLRVELIRYAQQLGFREELKQWEQEFALSTEDMPQKNQYGEVIVIYQSNWAPVKEQIKLPIPIKGGLVFIALPKYRPLSKTHGHLIIAEGNNQLGTTEVLCDIEATAIRYLKDKILALALKQAIRLVIRGVATKAAYDRAGIAGGITMSLVNLVTEQADLRSWLVLPGTIQVAHLYLKPGEHEISLCFTGGLKQERRTIHLNLEPGRITFLNIRNFDTTILWDVFPKPKGVEGNEDF